MSHETRTTILIACIVLAVSAVLYAAHKSDREYRDRHRTINVEETCEEVHAFVHNGRKYYCAPWIYPDTEESAPAAQETTNA